MEQTLVIVKPDAVANGLLGEVIRRFEAEDLTVCGLKMVWLSQKEAEGFYQVHQHQPFFQSLTHFMISGPCVAMVLEGEEAIRRVRTLMGATDPLKAAEGTLRRSFATSIEKNVVHGSDSAASATFEIPYFFSRLEILPKVGRGEIS
ncbi:nucleoside-diphosphate kinase [Candidatus Methylomirabilis sp.]|uniref:Nucleoside diphosphate kinase n=1 Tax=Candidatus Methylomirabilis tolerans TaxID=3123416 RepID=A0AAJ1AHW1_9BACT|nr:nucleoside-diphosphate kinase [Candidatus Methylomirabilis sp.]